MRRIVSWMMLAFLLVGTLALAFNVGLVHAQAETVYINSDGSVSPSSAPVSSPDNITYTLTGNINYPTYNGIVVERNNIVIDGAFYTVQGTGFPGSEGIYLSGISNVTIKNTNIKHFIYGIYLNGSSNNIVSGNNATANGIGISLGSHCYDNTLSGNNVTANSGDGINLFYSSGNVLSGNKVIANSGYGGIYLYSSCDNNTLSGNELSEAGVYDIILYSSCDNNVLSGNNVSARGILLEDSSSGNTFYHNNFIGNAFHVSSDGSPNTWDNGYPSGGNYWSDYNGTDVYIGPYQNVTENDGIGDASYIIDANNTDHYPLMGGFLDFSVAQGVDVQVVSNSTVSDFQFNGTAILFNVSGVNGTTGFCNVCVPTSLLNGTITVLVNGTQVQYSLLLSLNNSNSYLYFTYGHSTEQVTIMPEFPEPLIMAMFMLATLLTIAIHKKKHSRS